MSDKHTEAQGKLIYQRLQEDGAWRDTTLLGKQAWDESGRQTRTVFRATEGQAQTSAVDDDELFEKWVRHHLAMPENFKFISTSDWAVAAREGWIGHKHAAQLANSTAPGAPVEETFSCWSCKKPYTLIQRSYADGRCPHCDVDIELDDEPAAPTAQQSLTAGGAVQNLELVIARLEQIAEDFTDDYRNAAEEALVCARAVLPHVIPMTWQKHYDLGTSKEPAMLAEISDWRALAAAPLPQVQSEALKKLDRYDWSRDGMDSENNPMSGGDYLKYDDVEKLFDQQPVTPSGALADKDGGVAK